MNFNKYQELAQRTDNINTPRNEMESERALTNSALGVCGESGEFADIVKKIYHQGHEFTEDMQYKMIEELGDILWYVAKAARVLGCSMEYVAVLNIDKLKKRYPEGFDAERSKKRVPTFCEEGSESIYTGRDMK